MKKMKRLAALFLAVVMVMAMGMTAMAAPGEEGYTITLKGTEEKPILEGHNYKVYQIFKGSLNSDGTILSNVEYGENYKGGKKADGSAYASAYDEAKAIEANNDLVNSIKPTEPAVRTLTKENPSVNLTESGYYMVIDEGTGAAGDRVSKFIVKVGGNNHDIEITPKYSNVPGFEKEINDANKKPVDFKAGDPVPFVLRATMKEDIGTYDEYKLVFSDKLTSLKFNDDVTVSYKNGSDKVTIDSSNYKVESADDKSSFTVTIENILAVGKDKIVNNTEIIVEYTATLDKNADAGEVGKNEATLEYGNNDDNQGSGKTTTQTVKLYTFALDFDKVKEGGNPLDKAGFTLYAEDGTTEVEKIEAEEDKTNFVFNGLKAGTYILKETEVPDGYNKMEDVTITIDATVAADNKTVSDPTITVTVNGETKTGWTAVDGNSFKFTTEITNYAGAVLPSTGGIGTTIFYVVGGILVLGAAVLLITKKRMSARN